MKRKGEVNVQYKQFKNLLTYLMITIACLILKFVTNDETRFAPQEVTK